MESEIRFSDSDADFDIPPNSDISNSELQLIIPSLVKKYMKTDFSTEIFSDKCNMARLEAESFMKIANRYNLEESSGEIEQSIIVCKIV